MSIKNTGVGKWLGQSLDRLETAQAELLTAEQTGHKWFKLASDRRFEIERLQAEVERLRELLYKTTRTPFGLCNFSHLHNGGQCGECEACEHTKEVMKSVREALEEGDYE
jgi:hypothetical protein